jgi:hypothetical protein
VKKTNKVLLFVFALAPLSAYADIMHYSLCTLSGDSTIEDVQGWVEDWRKARDKAGVNYEARLLIGHAAPGEEMPPNFYIEGSSPNFADYGEAWTWWYSDDPGAVASSQQLFALATCGNQGVFTTVE